MGWLFTEGQTKKEVIERVTRTWTTTEDGDTITYMATDKAIRGNCLWVVFQRESGTGTTAFIALFLLRKERLYGWGYKDMQESMHPYYYTCPLSFLDKAPVACEPWREQVRAYHARMALANNLKVGQVITLVGSVVERVSIVYVGSRNTAVGMDLKTGKVYRIPKRMVGELVGVMGDDGKVVPQ